jgi:di/tricarboxylate transporter
VFSRVAGFFRRAFHDQALRWPLLLPLGLVAGAAIYMTAPFEPDWPVLIAPILIGLAGWVALRRRGSGMLALLMPIVACVGAERFPERSERLPSPSRSSKRRSAQFASKG